MNVAILTPIPSPYQVELWDAVAQDGVLRPKVVYIERTHPKRQWAPQSPVHEHVYLEDGSTSDKVAAEWVRNADLFVASWYADPRARKLIADRVSTGKPWCYWGERPGFAQWPLLGWIRRRWHLAALHNSQSPVWGIGTAAVEEWRREFGNAREYQNIPYFSNLARFARLGAAPPRPPGGVRFLFSGQFTTRKGIDLLASAFTAVARDRPDIHLELIGAGELESAVRAILKPFSNQVRFSGFQQWADLPAAYHRADLLVAPSLYDGWGLIVPEGLAAGLPVVTTDRTGAARDLIRPGENGWVVPAGSVTALRETLARAADLPPPKLALMSTAAIASVANHQLRDGVSRVVAAARAATERTL